ncbi:MAG: hypothetical protein IJ153_01765 [Clostridia bacterium]|nr:hypothetical protein [Clostridia bacterium]
MEEEKETISLESSRSTQISLESIREGDAGLNQHRQSMLNRVPEIGDSATFRHESLELIDLAYLTAKTGYEFAILRGKDIDILFHGDSRHCEFPETLVDMMLNNKVQILGHSHPGEDNPTPSPGDRIALRKLGQKRSVVVSGRTGKMIIFTQNPFEDIDL